ncbi:MAG: succinate dehydrogenase, cytochrome b556 subunit [Rhodobacteraceae bacterium]|nr:succinate dehydrogenase, cytochrome b556 subunit [Paracoccaceae bacterium]
MLLWKGVYDHRRMPLDAHQQEIWRAVVYFTKDGRRMCAARAFLTGWFGVLLLIGWSAAFYYHLFNGIRHLFWDAGYGFEKTQANASAWAVIVLTVLLTLGYWLTF